MNSTKDAYGQEVLAFFQKKEAYEIIERDDGFIDLSGGPASYFAQFKDWSEVEKRVIKLAKGRVLDVGSGAGRVALYLQKRGLEVTVIDNSPLAIKVCTLRGVKSALVLPIEKVSTFKPQTFDTIMMFGNNFGLFGSLNKARKLLKMFYQITTPQALIITENVDPYNTKDRVHLLYHQFNRKRGRMGGQLRIRVRFREYIGDWFDYLLVSQKELREIIKGTGWRVRRVVSSRGSSLYITILEKECL